MLLKNSRKLRLKIKKNIEMKMHLFSFKGLLVKSGPDIGPEP